MPIPKPSEVRDGIDKVVNPQVGLIAIFALSLSIVNTAYQLWQIAQDAEPQFLKPELILVVPDKYPTGNVFIRFAVGLSYVNLGAPQTSVVVTKESLSYSARNQRFTQEWQSFETFAGRACDLSSTESKDISPVVVSGKNAISHVTYFAPRVTAGEANPYVNFQSLDDFLVSTSGEVIELHIRAELLGSEALIHRCEARLTPHERTLLQQGCAITIGCG